ncbi:MAG: creatininase [Leptothrix sp. (in: b-proteobacteria)]
MTVMMNELSWLDYQARIHQARITPGSTTNTATGSDREPAMVFLPVGALEQHGPHLPLGTDALLATAVSADIARAVDGLVAPTLNYGYKSQPRCGGGQHFCGTTSVDAATLIGGVRDAVRGLGAHGLQRLVVVNGHYENQWFITEGIDLGLRDLGPDATLRVVRLEYWDFMTEALLADVFPEGFPGFALEHAAVIETSLMLHYHPNLVKLDQIPQHGPAIFPTYDTHPARPRWVPITGVLSSARGATADKGQRMAAEVAQRIAAAMRAEFAEAT